MARKILTELHSQDNTLMNILNEVKNRGAWRIDLLNKAVRALTRYYGHDIEDAWSKAFELHIQGFREERLSIDDVEECREAIIKF